MKAFSFPLLCSHQSKPRTHPLDYHRSSFLFCFSPRVPIQSIFISPLSSLYSCFHFNPISQSSTTPILHPSQSFHQLSDKLCLTSSTCLSSFSLFFQPSVLYFLSDCSLPRRFPLLLAYFVSYSLVLSHSLSLSLPPFLAMPSTDQLSSPVWCLFQPYTLGSTGQFKWFKDGFRHTQDRFNNVASKPIGVLKVLANLHLSPSASLTHQRTLSMHTLRQGTSFIITRLDSSPPKLIPGSLPAKKLLAFSIQNNVNKLWVLCISVLCSGRIAKWKGLSWEKGP